MRTRKNFSINKNKGDKISVETTYKESLLSFNQDKGKKKKLSVTVFSSANSPSPIDDWKVWELIRIAREARKILRRNNKQG